MEEELDEELEAELDTELEDLEESVETVAHAHHLRRCIRDLMENEGGVEGIRIYTTDEESEESVDSVFFDTLDELVSFLAEEMEHSWYATKYREDATCNLPDFEALTRKALLIDAHAKEVLPPEWLLEL